MRIYQPSKNESSISTVSNQARESSENLYQWSWVALTGPDAKDFLHRLTTVNLKFLPVGKGAPGFFLTPQGKIRVYFYLWNYGQNEYGFEFDAGTNGKWKSELLTVIDQFTFGEKITLTDVTGLESKWVFFEKDELASLSSIGADSLKAGETIAIDEEIRICHHGDQDFGKIWISAWGRPARLNQWVDQKLSNAQPVDTLEVESWRIQSLRPRVDREISETVLPLEIGLKEGIADNKGCYPGQEVIEKIVALGSPPRRLVLIHGTGSAPQPGQSIQSLAEPPAELGQVTSVSESEGKFFALGLLKKIYAKDEMKVRFSNLSVSDGVIIKIAPYGEESQKEATEK